MSDIPVKALSEIEVKSEVSENDKILILDSESEEARLASKEELKGDKGDKGDTGPQGPQGVQGLTGEKGDKGDPGVQGPKGDKGDQGIQGPTGLTGNTGPKGDTGAKGDKGDTGASIDSAAFVLNDIKFHKDDGTYVTLADAKIELKGDKGDKGDTGTISVGDVTTGAAGTDASVVNSGTSTEAVFDFTIPRGDKGDKGDKGNKGDTGASIVSAAFSSNDIVFTKDDSNTVTLADAKTTLKGDKGDTGNAATVSVGSTTTGEPGTSASVTNSGDTHSAVLNFTIPKGAKGDTGTAATVEVGTTTTGQAGTDASVTNSGTTSAAVFNFVIPKGDKGDTGSTGQTGPQGVSVTNFQKISGTGAAGTSDTYEFTLSNGNTFDFSVYNGANGEGSGDMLASQNLADLTNFATARTNLGVYSKTEIDTLLANFGGFEVVATLPVSDIKSNVIYLLGPIGTGADKYEEWIYYSSTWTKIGETTVDLSNYFNTSNQTSDVITEGSTNLFLTSSERTKLGNTSGTNTGDQTATDFDIKDLTDSTGLRDKWTNKQNALTEGSNISITTSGSTTTISATDTTYTASDFDIKDLSDSTSLRTTWNGKQDKLTAGTNIQIAADGKTISATDTTYSATDFDIKDLTDSTGLRTTWSGKQDALTVQTAYTSKGTSTKVPQITTNTLGQVTGITEVTIDQPTVNNTTITFTQNGTSVGDITLNQSSAETIALTDTTYESKTAASGGTDVSLVTTGEKYTWNNKQNALTTQTAYTTQGTATKVPTITTNTLGQVTAITETNITFPVTSVNSNTGAVTVSEFSPASAGSTGNVLTKTAGGYDWAAPAASGIVCDPSSPITIDKIRVGTESDYSNLGTYSATTAYMTV